MALVGSTDLPDNMGPASVGFLDSSTAPGIGPVCLFLFCLIVLIFYFYFYVLFLLFLKVFLLGGCYKGDGKIQRDWEMVRLEYIM